jgi:hypothetical protein
MAEGREGAPGSAAQGPHDGGSAGPSTGPAPASGAPAPGSVQLKTTGALQGAVFVDSLEGSTVGALRAEVARLLGGCSGEASTRPWTLATPRASLYLQAPNTYNVRRTLPATPSTSSRPAPAPCAPADLRRASVQTTQPASLPALLTRS